MDFQATLQLSLQPNNSLRRFTFKGDRGDKLSQYNFFGYKFKFTAIFYSFLFTYRHMKIIIIRHYIIFFEEEINLAKICQKRTKLLQSYLCNIILIFV